MSANIKSLRVRIKSVNSTLHLTKAMGLVASSKMRKASESMTNGREYAEAVKLTVNMLAGLNECKNSPYMQKKDGERTKIIIIAGDRGLAGGYNANVFRLAKEFDNAEFIPIGKRACERFSKETVLCEGYSFDSAMALAKKLCKEFLNGDFDKLGIISTEYISMLTQQAKIEYLLPIDDSNAVKVAGAIFEPNELTVLNDAIPEYIAGMIIAKVKESFASEVSARRTAMDSAGKNATQMIDDLQLKYNRARQGAITQEITEIVAGAGK
ncbi:MAG: ATP synthase F1 subunit gamma [Clostridia bacterium]|nr:ATP synthase F1 subunit gamma [Clostridia bacterium]